MSRFVKVSRVLSKLTCQKRNISWYTYYLVFSTFPGSNHFNFFLRKGLVPLQIAKNFLGLALLLLILRSRADRMGKLPKPYLLCISFTQRFRGRITSILFCWKALDLYFECPSKFWTLSATIN